MSSRSNARTQQPLVEDLSGRAVIAELNVVRYFGRGLDDSVQLGEGWAEPEENQNWNDGYDVSFEVALRAVPDSTCLLTLEVVPNLMPGVAHQDVTFYFNGLRLGFWRIEDMDQRSIEIEVEPEFWLKRHDGALGKCTLFLPSSSRPCDFSNSQDQRRLGLCFQSMKVAYKVAR